MGYLLMLLTMLASIEANNSECTVTMSNWLSKLQLRKTSNWYREKSFFLINVCSGPHFLATHIVVNTARPNSANDINYVLLSSSANQS